MTWPHIVYVGIALFAAVFVAYTMKWQGATCFWGKEMSPDNPMLPRGMQDAITPPAQTTRLLVLPLLLLGVLVAGFFALIWYTAIGAFALVLLGSGFVGLLLPKSDSRYFRDLIRRSLERRLGAYHASGDVLRQQAMEDVVTQFDSVAHGHTGRSDQSAQSDAASR